MYCSVLGDQAGVARGQCNDRLLLFSKARNSDGKSLELGPQTGGSKELEEGTRWRMEVNEKGKVKGN